MTDKQNLKQHLGICEWLYFEVYHRFHSGAFDIDYFRIDVISGNIEEFVNRTWKYYANPSTMQCMWIPEALASIYGINDMKKMMKLLPCPFCGSRSITVEREGTPKQSCIVVCEECGCRKESNEQGYGYHWNMRNGIPARE